MYFKEVGKQASSTKLRAPQNARSACAGAPGEEIVDEISRLTGSGEARADFLRLVLP